MKPRTKTALGIDISERGVSAALVEKTAQGLRVIAGATGDLPDVKPGQGMPPHAKALSRVLGKLGRRAKAHDAGIAVAVSTDPTVMRLLDLPKQMPANISEFVDNELKQCVALSGKRRRSDFCGIGTGSGSRRRLLVVAADTDQVGRIVETCAAAGAMVDSVEPSSLAYSRAFLAGEGSARHGGNAVIAVLGAQNLVVCLFCKGTLDFIRIRDIPAGAGGAGPLCAWLTEELQAVLRYCLTDGPGEGTPWQARLVLHGAAYSKDDIASGLTMEAAGRPLEIVDCCEPLAGLSGTMEDARAQSPSAVAVGAAMKLLDVEGDELRIDLMPQEVVQARLSSRRMLIMANAAAIVLVAVLLIVELLTQTANAMDRQIEKTRLAERLPMMPALIQEDKYLDREIAQLQGHLARLQTVCTRREMDWPAVLNSIWQAKPAGVSVTSFLCDDNRAVLLKGAAASHGQAKAFVQSLDGREPFEWAWMKHIQRQQDDDRVFEFEIHCAVRTGY